MSPNLAAFLYLASGILFILALRGLSSPETSRQGNLFGISGMIIAIIVTFLVVESFSKEFIYVLIFLSAGGIIGYKNILNKLPLSATKLYSKNLYNFFFNLYDKEKKNLNINLKDEIINKTFIQNKNT